MLVQGRTTRVRSRRFGGPRPRAVVLALLVAFAFPAARALAVCGDGVLDDGEQCDDGNLAAGDCCSPTCTFEPATTLCRAQIGPCDLNEFCTGTSGTCPPDAFAGPGLVCRAASGPCDVAETCTGTSAGCPPNAFAPSSVVCRPGVGPCDAAETCTGSGPDCPADALSPATAVCRPSTGGCDAPELCTGTSITCPPDTGTPDTDADGVCDAQDDCPLAPDPAQADTDGDGIGDACDPCTNGGSLTRAKLLLVRILAPGGDDRLRVKGVLSLPPTATTPPIDIPGRGFRLLLTDAGGVVRLDATIPPTPFDRATKSGWTKNNAGNVFAYRNAGQSVIAGIVKAVFKQAAPRTFKVVIVGAGGDYAVPSSGGPVRITLVIDPPAATTGQCGDTGFTTADCVFAKDGSRLLCK